MEIEDLRTVRGGLRRRWRKFGGSTSRLAKSIVSRRVLAWRRNSGVQLLARTTRGSALTEAGALFVIVRRTSASTIEARVRRFSRRELQACCESRPLPRLPHSLPPSLAGARAASSGAPRPYPFNDRHVDLVAEVSIAAFVSAILLIRIW